MVGQEDREMGFAKALKEGRPVVFTGKEVPEVICEVGSEAEALDLLEKMELITIVRPQSGETGWVCPQCSYKKNSPTDEKCGYCGSSRTVAP
jgi:rubrerythrin